APPKRHSTDCTPHLAPLSGAPTRAAIHKNKRCIFAGSLRKWLIKINDGRPVPDGAITVQKIDNAEGLKKYLAKGTEPHFARFCRIRPQDTGTVHGRKSGVSCNLGPAERMPRSAALKAARRCAA
ncbi:MAG: hypothetical protein AAFR75_01240, partial [Pseudomonadota bacterium]